MTTNGAKIPYSTFMEIVWNDAASHDGWVEIDADTEPVRIITRGWLIKDTDVYFMLAASLHMDDASTVGSTQIIPKGMILSQRILKVTNASSKPRHKVHSQSCTKELHREPSES